VKLSHLSQTVIQEAEVERGNIEKMKILTDWITDTNNKIKSNLENRDVRMSRLFILELKGFVEQLENHAELLSKDIGLPEID